MLPKWFRLNELDPYIQDALDLIEFANGDVTTKWGKLRADNGTSGKVQSEIYWCWK